MKPCSKIIINAGSASFVAMMVSVLLSSCGGRTLVDPQIVFRIDEIESIYIQGIDNKRKMVGIELNAAQRDKWIEKFRKYTQKGDGGNVFFGNMFLTLKTGDVKEISLYSRGSGCNVWDAGEYNGSLVMDGNSYIIPKVSKN